MRNKDAVLETRVRGVNAANHFANLLYPKLLSVFGNFVGEKIEKVGGGLLQKVQNEVNALGLPNTVKLSVYRYASNYSLVYVVKTCETLDGGAYYHETSVYVGEMSNGVLTKITPAPNFKTDYSAETVKAAREAYETAKKAADAAHSALFPFGEYDR